MSAFVTTTIEGHTFVECGACGADADWIDCENCTDGVTGHDCGEDTCCCADPEDNVTCDICDGAEGWYVCSARCDVRPSGAALGRPS